MEEGDGQSARKEMWGNRVQTDIQMDQQVENMEEKRGKRLA